MHIIPGQKYRMLWLVSGEVGAAVNVADVFIQFPGLYMEVNLCEEWQYLQEVNPHHAIAAPKAISSCSHTTKSEIGPISRFAFPLRSHETFLPLEIVTWLVLTVSAAP